VNPGKVRTLPDEHSEFDQTSEDDEANDATIPEQLQQFAAALCAANPELTTEEALYFLPHNAHGRALAEHLSSISTKKETPINVPVPNNSNRSPKTSASPS
jgi:hypothetical protein